MPRAILIRQTYVMAITFAAVLLASGPDAFAATDPSPRVPPALAAAVADSSRPDSDTTRDTDRKPEPTLAFSGVKPGDGVADYVADSGYFTRLFDPAIQDELICVSAGPQIAEAQCVWEARAIAQSPDAQAPDAGCALPAEPWGVPAALDAAITGPADKDRACMKALLIPDARITFVALGADGATSYKLLTLDDWIARTNARGHVVLEEKQLNFRIDRFGNIAHLWSLYALRSEGHAVSRGINSIQAIKEPGGWRVAGIMVQSESAAAPLPAEFQP